MSRSSSPATHWDHLGAWLSAMKEALLPEATRDLPDWTHEQLDGDLNRLMAYDPVQSYTHNELVKIIRALAHNLITQVKLSDGTVTLLEQDTVALKLQAEEARRNQADAQNRLDQLTLEAQKPAKEEWHVELKEEVERLQETLTDLRTHTERRERLEKQAREDLECKLQEAETLLKRAETELKEREAKAKASKRHFQAARAEVQALAQQQDQLKAEFDTVQRELKYAYHFQAEQKGGKHTTESPPTSWNRLPSQARSKKEEAGKPNPAGGHDVHAYLQDIDFHLETMVNVSTRDRLYLLRITSSREVRSFLYRQSDTVKRDYKQLQQVLIKEFSYPESEQGLVAAMDLKQGRLETPPAYYNRLRQTYFGARNEPEMEEDFNLRIIFLRNLHPSVSHHLGVMACSRTMTTQQLRDMAHKAYVKHKTTS
ncbi:uncharacterized protein LOC130551023 [Triplophysa rosa]|uniref:uncharacterized protein LOC130551023 n=1 Tax=Triplophysa rosa TaxID=992332 RepID=UPI0025461744|nr:uncharacterized protein LOC130551023 [Triplophysa rosa]